MQHEHMAMLPCLAGVLDAYAAAARAATCCLTQLMQQGRVQLSAPEQQPQQYAVASKLATAADVGCCLLDAWGDWTLSVPLQQAMQSAGSMFLATLQPTAALLALAISRNFFWGKLPREETK